MHAGELAVSLLLQAALSLVGDSRSDRDHQAGGRCHLLRTGMPGYTSTGVIGQPSEGMAAKGRAVLDSLAKSFGMHLRMLTSS
jgi:creatinine amidohydrolase